MQIHYPLNPTTGVEDQSQLPWTNGVPQTGQEGSYPPFQAMVEPMTELTNLIAQSQQTGTSNDLFQATRAIRSGQLDYGNDTGTANALVVSIGLAHTQIKAGLPFKVLKGGNPNSSATPTLTVTGPAGANAISGVITKCDGSAVSAGDLPANAMLIVVADGVNWRLLALVLKSDVLAFTKTIARIKLTGAATFYFRSDATGTAPTGLTNTQSDAYASAQVAWNTLASTYDFAGFGVTLMAGIPGPYAPVLFSNLGAQGQVLLTTNAVASPGTYTMTRDVVNGWHVATDISTVTVDGGWTFPDGFVGAGNCLFVRGPGAAMQVGAVNFVVNNANPSLTLISASGGKVNPIGKTITVSGGGSFGSVVGTSAEGVYASYTTGTSTYTLSNVAWASFVSSTDGSSQSWDPNHTAFNTTGCTGSRYSITTRGGVNTYGSALATFFPGTTAGTNTTTGGDSSDASSILSVLANLGFTSGTGYKYISTAQGRLLTVRGTATVAAGGGGTVVPWPAAFSGTPVVTVAVQTAGTTTTGFMVEAAGANGANFTAYVQRTSSGGTVDTPGVTISYSAEGPG